MIIYNNNIKNSEGEKTKYVKRTRVKRESNIYIIGVKKNKIKLGTFATSAVTRRCYKQRTKFFGREKKKKKKGAP